MTADVDILLLPGLGGSGNAHWQARWSQAFDRCRIVEQADWDAPDRDEWLARLDAAIQATAAPFVLVAHSVGCALAAHWVSHTPNHPGLLGLMMVAPADVDSPEHTPDLVRSFAPMPAGRLPRRTVVVASSDDPYVALDRARSLARAWGGTLVEIGPRGHINGDSGLGDWPEGKHLLRSLIQAEVDDPSPTAMHEAS